MDGIEFFPHSPFAHRQDEDELVDRNRGSLVLQATFRYGGQDVRLFLSADSSHEALAAIVRISLYHGNGDRLEWDIMKIAHHCSTRRWAQRSAPRLPSPFPRWPGSSTSLPTTGASSSPAAISSPQ